MNLEVEVIKFNNLKYHFFDSNSFRIIHESSRNIIYELKSQPEKIISLSFLFNGVRISYANNCRRGYFMSLENFLESIEDEELRIKFLFNLDLFT